MPILCKPLSSLDPKDLNYFDFHFIFALIVRNECYSSKLDINDYIKVIIKVDDKMEANVSLSEQFHTSIEKS